MPCREMYRPDNQVLLGDGGANAPSGGSQITSSNTKSVFIAVSDVCRESQYLLRGVPALALSLETEPKSLSAHRGQLRASRVLES